MSKKRKTWSIVLIVVGGLALIGSIADLKQYWFSLICALCMIAGGIVLLVTGKKRAAAIADRKKAEAAARIAEAEAKAGPYAEKKVLTFRATYVEKYQDRIAEAMQKVSPVCEIKPYLSYDKTTYRYSVLVDDKKIGEAPGRCFNELAVILNHQRTIEYSYVPSENGYDVNVTCTYWV